MAVSLSLCSRQVSDLCLGKPALVWLPLSATIAAALKAFKDSSHVTELAVCSCDQTNHRSTSDKTRDGSIGEEGRCCLCKISMVDVICFLSRDESLANPQNALSSAISALVPAIPKQLRHVDTHASLLHGLDLIAGGAESLIVPIPDKRKTPSSAEKQQPKMIVGEFCWVTHEDVVRFLMEFIGVLPPLPLMTIQDLGLINTDVLRIDSAKPASEAVTMIQIASHTQRAVAVLEQLSGESPKLVGEISPRALMSCDESVALALATLSAGDFATYIKCGRASECLIEKVRLGISQKRIQNPRQFDDEEDDSTVQSDTSLSSTEDSTSSVSSDDESLTDSSSSSGKFSKCRTTGWRRDGASYGWKGRSAVVTCRRRSTLIAAIVQALANRLNYMWVTDDDSSLIGIVSFRDILDLFCNHLHSITDASNQSQH